MLGCLKSNSCCPNSGIILLAMAITGDTGQHGTSCGIISDSQILVMVVHWDFLLLQAPGSQSSKGVNCEIGHQPLSYSFPETFFQGVRCFLNKCMHTVTICVTIPFLFFISWSNLPYLIQRSYQMHLSWSYPILLFWSYRAAIDMRLPCAIHAFTSCPLHSHLHAITLCCTCLDHVLDMLLPCVTLLIYLASQ